MERNDSLYMNKKTIRLVFLERKIIMGLDKKNKKEFTG